VWHRGRSKRGKKMDTFHSKGLDQVSGEQSGAMEVEGLLAAPRITSHNPIAFPFLRSRESRDLSTVKPITGARKSKLRMTARLIPVTFTRRAIVASLVPSRPECCSYRAADCADRQRLRQRTVKLLPEPTLNSAPPFHSGPLPTCFPLQPDFGPNFFWAPRQPPQTTLPSKQPSPRSAFGAIVGPTACPQWMPPPFEVASLRRSTLMPTSAGGLSFS
jgi:hypothetical protein